MPFTAGSKRKRQRTRRSKPKARVLRGCYTTPDGSTTRDYRPGAGIKYKRKEFAHPMPEPSRNLREEECCIPESRPSRIIVQLRCDPDNCTPRERRTLGFALKFKPPGAYLAVNNRTESYVAADGKRHGREVLGTSDCWCEVRGAESHAIVEWLMRFVPLAFRRYTETKACIEGTGSNEFMPRPREIKAKDRRARAARQGYLGTREMDGFLSVKPESIENKYQEPLGKRVDQGRRNYRMDGTSWVYDAANGNLGESSTRYTEYSTGTRDYTPVS